MTAVIRFADASFAAWIMRRSSIRLRSTGSQPVWTMNTSAPRIDSLVAAVRLAVRERLQLDLAELDAELLGDLLRELRVRATGEHHQPLLRRERDRVPGLHLDARHLGLEPGQRLLNRSAFHRVLPCSPAAPARSRARRGVHPL